MVGVSRYTVAEYLRRAAVVGITWPVPAALDDVALERKLFTPPFTPAEALRPQPEWARIHAELRRPGVTLRIRPARAANTGWSGSPGSIRAEVLPVPGQQLVQAIGGMVGDASQDVSQPGVEGRRRSAWP